MSEYAKSWARLKCFKVFSSPPHHLQNQHSIHNHHEMRNDEICYDIRLTREKSGDMNESKSREIETAISIQHTITHQKFRKYLLSVPQNES